MRQPATFAFLTLPRYSMIAVVNAIEALRMANLLTGRAVYEWHTSSLDGSPAVASNDLTMTPTVALSALPPVDIVFVCGGVAIGEALSPALLTALRRLHRQHRALGGLCTGGYALAEAGLLDGYRATIHWENLSALRERFPRVRISEQLFTIDRDRYTCSGGIAPLDLMLHFVRGQLGVEVAQRVQEQFIVERVRGEEDRQYVPLRAQVGAGHESILGVARLMEANIEKPLSLEEISAASGLSRRQIERLFKRHVQCEPKKYYLQIRLRRARELLLQTPMSILEITTACGFQSPPHFSRCYRREYGHPPSAERDARSAAAAVPSRRSVPAAAAPALVADRHGAVAKEPVGTGPTSVPWLQAFAGTTAGVAGGSPGGRPTMSTDAEEFDLASLDDGELTEQVHDDLYNGLKAEVEQATRIFLGRGWPAERVLNEALVEGMRIVGIDFRDGILFVPEVLLAANAMKAGMEILRPLLAETGVEPIGKVVIGTVKGDIHDIGKNLVSMMLEGAGFEVIDLGINTPVEKYLDALERHKPDILGMSALLTTTMPYMKVVVDTLKEKGIRKDYIVLVGGAPLNEEFGKAVGADAYCRDAAIAVETAKGLIAARRAAAR